MPACRKCLADKPTDDFQQMGDRRDTTCRACRIARRRELHPKPATCSRCGEPRHRGRCAAASTNDCALHIGKSGGVDGVRIRPTPCVEERDPVRRHLCRVHGELVQKMIDDNRIAGGYSGGPLLPREWRLRADLSPIAEQHEAQQFYISAPGAG